MRPTGVCWPGQPDPTQCTHDSVGYEGMLMLARVKSQEPSRAVSMPWVWVVVENNIWTSGHTNLLQFLLFFHPNPLCLPPMDEVPGRALQQLFCPVLITQGQNARLDEVEEQLIALSDFTEDNHRNPATELLQTMRLQVQQLCVHLESISKPPDFGLEPEHSKVCQSAWPTPMNRPELSLNRVGSIFLSFFLSFFIAAGFRRLANLNAANTTRTSFSRSVRTQRPTQSQSAAEPLDCCPHWKERCRCCRWRFEWILIWMFGKRVTKGI